MILSILMIAFLTILVIARFDDCAVPVFAHRKSFEKDLRNFRSTCDYQVID